MKKQIMYRIIVMFLVVTNLFFIPVIPIYTLKLSGKGAISSQSIEKEIAQIFKGSDPDAIYLRLHTKPYEIIEPTLEFTYQVNGTVIVKMEGFSQDSSPGDPALPYQVCPIALPPEAVAESLDIEVIHLNEREIPGEYIIAAAPPYLLDLEVPTEERILWEMTQWGIGKEIMNGQNILIYEKDEFYPLEYCKVISGSQFRKWKVATIIYYPIRYNPIQSKLIMAEEIILKVSFERNYDYLKQKMTKKLLKDFVFDEQAKSLFLNYDQAKDWYLRPLYEGLITDENENETLEDPNYAIITTEDIFTNSNTLDDFCFHKQDLGFTVIVVTEHNTHTVDGTTGSYSFINSVGGYEDLVGAPPNRRSEKIRQWLIDNYLILNIEYVLLIGNPDPDNIEPDDLIGDIPMQTCWTSILNDYPTDIYYSDLSGNWNLDGDIYVGEKYSETDVTTGYSDSNLPNGVTGDLFSVRWDGVVEVTGAAVSANVYFYGYSDGQTKIWFDEDNDGINQDVEDDVILPYEEDEHHPEYYYYYTNLADGTYQIITNYSQSSGDAYFNLEVKTYTPDVSVTFKHDDGTGNYVDGLNASYFNDNDYSAPPDVERVETNPDILFIKGGDRGIGGVDFYPEVIVGRIPFYGEDENSDSIPDYEILDNILTKIIVYENADVYQETWRRRVLISTPYMYDWDDFPGYETADYKGGETLMDDITPPPLWDWYRIHEEDYPDVFPDAEVNTGCNVSEMVNGWNDPVDPNDGRGVVMWRTHGSQTGASKVFSETNCTDLDDSKPSIVIQTACKNGYPEVEEWGGIKHYPLSYSLLKHGAIATISSSRNSWGGLFDPDDISIAYKNNPYLCYFLARGIFSNIDVGEVLAHVRVEDAMLGLNWAQIFNYNLFGDPSLSLFGVDPKSNNDIIFLLDGSGSMLSEGKWEAAVDATVIYYELMKELRHPAFHDRYSSIVFRWDNSAGVDISTTVPSGNGLHDLSVSLTTSILNAETPIPSYCTPIGEGLSKAIDLLDLNSEESFYSTKSILLLSDGKQNRGIDPLDVYIPEEVKVYAVGLGEDYIEPETISDIASASNGDFRITPNPREMEDFFLQILCDTSWKLQDVPVIDDTVPIDQDMAVFIVVWDNPTTTLSFELDPPGEGPNITPTTGQMAYPPMDVTYHPASTGATHAFYVCKNIPNELFGDWKFANLPVPLTDVLLKVVEDPQTIADFNIENIDYYIGQPIMLTATIIEDAKPKIGLTEIYAELIRSPAQAVGTLMAKNTPSSKYPTLPPNNTDLTLYNYYLLGVMNNMGMESLSNVGGPRIYLRDDGLGCDSKANDGVYTGLFTDTTYEGSYTFKFRARGENKDGVTFDRTETLSKYVKFAASPIKTKVELISTVKDRDKNITKTIIKITPRNADNAYLGPFFGDSIQFWSSIREFDLSYIDNLDGSYSFTLIYPIDKIPLISISVGDVFVSEKTLVKIKEDNLLWFLLIPLSIFLAIILLILIFTIKRKYVERKKPERNFQKNDFTKTSYGGINRCF